MQFFAYLGNKDSMVLNIFGFEPVSSINLDISSTVELIGCVTIRLYPLKTFANSLRMTSGLFSGRINSSIALL